MTRGEFIQLIHDEQESLRGFLLVMCCGNKDEADDIAQDTLVKAYLAYTGYQDKGKFRSWLFKIAHNTFLNHKESQRTYDNIDEARNIVGTFDTDASYAHQDLYIALATLPPKERSAIVLFYLDGYSVREIATITDQSEDAIKKQLSRGRDKLKTRLKI